MTNKWLYLIWICVGYWCFGCLFSIFPTVVGKIYGPQTGSLVYAVVFWGFPISTLLSIFYMNVIVEQLNYEYVFYWLTVSTVIALVL